MSESKQEPPTNNRRKRYCTISPNPTLLIVTSLCVYPTLHAKADLYSTTSRPLLPPGYFVGGNWKLNGTRESVEALVKTYNDGGAFPAAVQVMIAPTALHIGYVMDHVRADVLVGAQNISTDKGFGAFTGELSAELFKAYGVGWTLTGHSERRRRQQTRNKGHDEGASSVAEKTRHALNAGLSVVLCIGETLTDREEGRTLDVCFDQLQAVKDAIAVEDWERIVVAYEPVWAIGTGVAATANQAQEVHEALRKWIMTQVRGET